MKILYCPVCDDVIRLIAVEWRTCQCKRSGGQYTPDSLTVVIGGIGKVFGIPNPFFDEAYMASPEVIKYGNTWITEVWWGEYKGDCQIIRVKNAMAGVPTNWESRLSKLVKIGGAIGYEGRTEIENNMREKQRGKALLRHVLGDLGRRLWKRWRKKSKDELIMELITEVKRLNEENVKLKSLKDNKDNNHECQ